MTNILSGYDFEVNGLITHYLDGGPTDGPLLFFIHGWPDVALSWKHQLLHFASLGFRVIAPDMRGYGQSSAPKDRLAYSLERLAKEQLALLHHVGREKAFWVAHDWGCAVLSALAAHYPEAVAGGVWQSVPYGVQEKGLDALVGIVNRELYPEAEFPYGQWSYMKYYELHTDDAIAQLDSVTDKFLKLIYSKSHPKDYGRLAPTSRTVEEGNLYGWFGGSPETMPDLPLSSTSLDEELYALLRENVRKNGWFPATAYYLNSDVNAEYDKSRVNDGRLDVPCLLIDSKYDPICTATVSPTHSEAMREKCRDLTEVCIEAAHWTHREKPEEVNAVLEKWLREKLADLWPSYKKTAA